MVAVKSLYLSEGNCNSLLGKWLLFFTYLTSLYKPIFIDITLVSY